MIKLDIANEAVSKEIWRRAANTVQTADGQDILEDKMENKDTNEVAMQKLTNGIV